MTAYESICTELQQAPKTWLVTGAAGFIGSHLVERLLALGQRVVALDNFSTGHQRNLDDVLERAGVAVRFRLINGDTRDLRRCRDACEGVDVVLHQAALASAPRSIADPLASHGANVDGFINILVAAHDAGATRFVYASSKSDYGDSTRLADDVDASRGRALSPYAATKVVDEIYAWAFQCTYALETVGLRYFNVFGARQEARGPRAAVIPRWISAMLAGAPCTIYGDGETSRDFCHVDDVVQANLLAATAQGTGVTGRVYDVGRGEGITLKELFALVRAALASCSPRSPSPTPEFRDFRPGDIRHSVADIAAISERVGYSPTHSVAAGLQRTIGWYVARHRSSRAHAARRSASADSTVCRREHMRDRA